MVPKCLKSGMKPSFVLNEVERKIRHEKRTAKYRQIYFDNLKKIEINFVQALVLLIQFQSKFKISRLHTVFRAFPNYLFSAKVSEYLLHQKKSRMILIYISLEGHKIQRNLPLSLMLLSNVKVALSEKLNFTCLNIFFLFRFFK